jgi:hypothetical protein
LNFLEDKEQGILSHLDAKGYFEYLVKWDKTDANWIFNKLSEQDKKLVCHITEECGMTPADALLMLR